MENKSEIDAASVVTLAIAGTLLVVEIIFGLQALYYKMEEQERFSKVVTAAPEELSRLRAEQLEALHSYRWIDQKNGVVGIPIEKSMEIVERDAAGQTAPAAPAAARQ